MPKPEPVVRATLGPLSWSLSAQELARTTAEIVLHARRGLAALEETPGPNSVERFLEPLDRILIQVRDIGSHGGFVFAVHPDAATRTAGREASEAADRFWNEFRVNETVYRRLRSLDLAGADGPTRFAVEKMLREMRRAGAEKDEAARARLLALNNEIDKVSNQYNQNIAEHERGIDVASPADLAGLPADFLASHRPGPDGRTRITTRYPDFGPVMAYAERSDVRRRLLSEFMNRAYPENSAVLDRLLALRFELATLLGYPEFAAYAIEDKMLERPEAVRAFLDRIAGFLNAPARADLDRFLARKRQDEPNAPRLDLWDASFYGEGYYDNKLKKEEFGVDTKILRAYLPYPQVRDGLFALCEELFGIRFHRVRTEELWHPSVEAYDVTRRGRATGSVLPRPSAAGGEVQPRGVVRRPGGYRGPPAPPERPGLQLLGCLATPGERPDAGTGTS